MRSEASSLLVALAVAVVAMTPACSRQQEQARATVTAASIDVPPTTAPTTTAPATGVSTTTAPTTDTSTTDTSTTDTSTTDTSATTPGAALADSGVSLANPPESEATVVVAAEITLRSGGLGPVDFGVGRGAASAQLAGLFGAPISAATIDLPISEGDLYLTSDGRRAFPEPVAEVACWTQLCAVYGGADLATSTLRGWTYGDRSSAEAEPTFADARGITIGSRWSDFLASMTVDAGGCPDNGVGRTADGIELALSGGSFATVDDDGEYVELLPDPAMVRVTALHAGAVVVELEAGCR